MSNYIMTDSRDDTVLYTQYRVGYQIAEMLHDWYIVFQAPYK